MLVSKGVVDHVNLYIFSSCLAVYMHTVVE